MQISLLEWHGVLDAWLAISAFLLAIGGLGFAAASRWRRSAWLSSPFIAFLAFQFATKLIPPSGDDFTPSLVRRLWVFYIAILASGLVSLTLPILGARRNRPGRQGPAPPDSSSGIVGT